MSDFDFNVTPEMSRAEITLVLVARPNFLEAPVGVGEGPLAAVGIPTMVLRQCEEAPVARVRFRTGRLDRVSEVCNRRCMFTLPVIEQPEAAGDHGRISMLSCDA